LDEQHAEFAVDLAGGSDARSCWQSAMAFVGQPAFLVLSPAPRSTRTASWPWPSSGRDRRRDCRWRGDFGVGSASISSMALAYSSIAFAHCSFARASEPFLELFPIRHAPAAQERGGDSAFQERGRIFPLRVVTRTAGGVNAPGKRHSYSRQLPDVAAVHTRDPPGVRPPARSPDRPTAWAELRRGDERFLGLEAPAHRSVIIRADGPREEPGLKSVAGPRPHRHPQRRRWPASPGQKHERAGQERLPSRSPEGFYPGAGDRAQMIGELAPSGRELSAWTVQLVACSFRPRPYARRHEDRRTLFEAEHPFAERRRRLGQPSRTTREHLLDESWT